MHALLGDLEGEPNFTIVEQILKSEKLKIDESTTGQFYNILKPLQNLHNHKKLFSEYEKLNEKEPILKEMNKRLNPGMNIVGEFFTTKELAEWHKYTDYIKNPPQLTHAQQSWFEAVHSSDTETINQIIQSATDINTTDHVGRTALWFAAYKGDVVLLEILLASDGLNIDKQTAGEFHTDLFVLRDCMISGKIDKEEIRKALTELTTDPYPSVYAPLLEKVGGTSPHDTSIFNRLKQSLFTTICVNTGFRN
ncbi:hypothetical protein D3C86_1528510 [compost metagenome]